MMCMRELRWEKLERLTKKLRVALIYKCLTFSVKISKKLQLAYEASSKWSEDEETVVMQICDFKLFGIKTRALESLGVYNTRNNVPNEFNLS